MTHVVAFLVAGVLFLLASALLWFGRAAVGTSTPLLGAVVAGYLGALSIAFPAQMATARAELRAWYQAWKDATGPGAGGGAA